MWLLALSLVAMCAGIVALLVWSCTATRGKEHFNDKGVKHGNR